MLTKPIHKLASPLFYGSGAYQWLWQRRARSQPFTVVLVYHRIVEDGQLRDDSFSIERGVSAEVFEAQLRFMLKHFSPIPGSKVLEPSSTPLRFAVTLDDGYEDNFRIAAPILQRLGIPATFYVVSDFVGTDRLFWWEQLAEMMRQTRLPLLDLSVTLPELLGREGLPQQLPLHNHAQREHAYERLSAAIRGGKHAMVPSHMTRLAEALDVVPRIEGRQYGLMNWIQLQELVAQGHEIGGHTATHSNVVGLASDTLQREVIDSITVIEEHLAVPVLSFAYPYGHFDTGNNSVGEALSGSNCKVAFTGRKGVVQAPYRPFELPRTCLNRRFPFACAFNVQDTLNQSKMVA